MSFPEFKDFDAAVQETLGGDFSTDCSLTVNTAAPAGVAMSTTTDLKSSNFLTTTNFGWAHESGFAIDSLELASLQKVALATSVSGILPGLQLNFKGVDASATTLGMTYKHKLATISHELDIAGFSTMSASVMGGSNGILAGAGATFGLGGKFEVTDFSAAVGYAPKPEIFAGVKATNKFTELNTAFQYAIRPNLTLSALIDYAPSTGAHKYSVGATHSCGKAGANFKMKINNEGVINASVKKALPNSLTVVGAASLDSRHLDTYTLGVTATLG